jgi:hypothetical protein
MALRASDLVRKEEETTGRGVEKLTSSILTTERGGRS